MNKTLVGAVLVVILAIAAYFVWFDEDSLNSTDTNQEVTNNSTNTQSETPQNNEQTIPASWPKYESPELKLSFNFPPIPTGTTKYSFETFPTRLTDPTGTNYHWDVTRTDVDKGYTYSFAGGGSRDLKIGRSCWITDVHSFEERGGKFYLNQCSLKEVQPVKTIVHSAGAKAIVYDWQIPSAGTYRAATLNFPANYHDKLGGISFLFYDQTSLEDIEKVINSVRFPK